MNAKMLVLACLLVAGTANAGYQYRPQVSVNTVNRTAQGSLIGARRSADTPVQRGNAVAWRTWPRSSSSKAPR